MIDEEKLSELLNNWGRAPKADGIITCLPALAKRQKVK
jgi:hypothetical protein